MSASGPKAFPIRHTAVAGHSDIILDNRHDTSAQSKKRILTEDSYECAFKRGICDLDNA